MPELPEITNLARQMQAALVGKTLTGIEILQPKCLNVPEDDFVTGLTGARIASVRNRGKWLIAETTQGYLLISLGMGGEVLLVTRETLPEKYRFVFDFADGSALALNFWWFGYVHYAAPGELAGHEMTAKLGPNALALTRAEFGRLLDGRRSRVKSFLLDQSKVSGIGNFYVHDILFRARLHPLRTVNTLDEAHVDALFRAIHDGLQPSLDLGGAAYELDLFGQKGGYTTDHLLVAYREGEPCPVCGAEIDKIKTGSTSSFICPECQPVI